jgi:dihydroorotate dehydrogenase
MLDELVSALQARNDELSPPGQRKPLLVKISPDLADADIEAAADVCLRNGVAGIIATNTTVAREGLKTANAASFGPGGLSGRPQRQRAKDLVKLQHRCTGGEITIVGVGGIFTAEDAFERIASGASLLEVYTGFVYGGPAFPSTIIKHLDEIMTRRGISSVNEAVGSAEMF